MAKSLHGTVRSRASRRHDALDGTRHRLVSHLNDPAVSMELFLQQMVNGLASGAFYALFATGFGLLFATMNILNVAHGTFATWSAISMWWFVSKWGLGIVPAVLLAVLVVGVLGVVVDLVVFDPLRRRSTRGFFGVLLASIGVWIVLLNLALIATGASFKSMPVDSYSRNFYDIGPITVSNMQLLAIALALGIGAVLYVFVHRTRYGAAVRAVGANAPSAGLAGVNSRVVMMSVSFIAAGVAAVAGVVSALATNSISFQLGEELLVKGFAAVVIGGWGDVRGPVIGGFLIGVVVITCRRALGRPWSTFASSWRPLSRTLLAWQVAPQLREMEM